MKKLTITLLAIIIFFTCFAAAHIWRGISPLDVAALDDNLYGKFSIKNSHIEYSIKHGTQHDNFWYEQETTSLKEHMQTLNRMRRIWQAKLQYEQEYGETLPLTTSDPNEGKLYSWRTLLLPYLGRQEYYDNIVQDRSSGSESDLHALENTSILALPPKDFESSGDGEITPYDHEICALQLPDGRKDFILLERNNLLDLSPKEQELRSSVGSYIDLNHKVTIEQIQNGSFLKSMRFVPLHEDRRFLICCERGEFLVSIDISSKELERFILEKCCKN